MVTGSQSRVWNGPQVLPHNSDRGYITGCNPSVCKSNRLHVDILQFGQLERYLGGWGQLNNGHMRHDMGLLVKSFFFFFSSFVVVFVRTTMGHLCFRSYPLCFAMPVVAAAQGSQLSGFHVVKKFGPRVFRWEEVTRWLKIFSSRSCGDRRDGTGSYTIRAYSLFIQRKNLEWVCSPKVTSFPSWVDTEISSKDLEFV